MGPVRYSVFTLSVFLTVLVPTLSWSTAPTVKAASSVSRIPSFASNPYPSNPARTRTALGIGTKEKEDTESTQAETPSVNVDETTEKYGLEAGLFQSLKSEDGGESAKSLLKKYGIAYLATSIPLAAVSFAICYVLVDNGVDVAGLLAKVGIQGGDMGEKAGTFAIAYAAHKAASPIRFPPTVILTPVVAKIIGKEPEEAEGDEAASEQ